MKNIIKRSSLIALTTLLVITNNSYAIFGQKGGSRRTRSTRGRRPRRNNAARRSNNARRNPNRRPARPIANRRANPNRNRRANPTRRARNSNARPRPASRRSNQNRRRTAVRRNNQNRRRRNPRRNPINNSRNNQRNNQNVQAQPNRPTEPEPTADQIREQQEILRQIQERQRREQQALRPFDELRAQDERQRREQAEILRQIQERNQRTRRNSNPNNQMPVNNQENNRQRRNSTGGQHKCVICFDDKPVRDCCRLSCNHTFCRACLRTMFDNAMRERNTTTLRCPNPDCANPMTEQDIRTITNNNRAQMDTYANVTTREWIRRQPNAKHCPTPNCNYAIIGERGVRRNVICPQCNNNFCANPNCEVQHRLGEPCQTEEQWMAQNVKPCPNCRARIQKNGGCIHMTCQNCRHEFCWVCTRQWRGHGGGFYNCALRGQ